MEGKGPPAPATMSAPYRLRSRSFCCFKTIFNCLIMPKLRQVAWGLYVGCIVGCLTDTTTHCKGVTCIFCFQFCNQGSIKAPNIHFVVSLLYSKVLLVSLVTETETGRLAEILLSPAQLQPQGLHFFLSFLNQQCKYKLAVLYLSLKTSVTSNKY